jgi:FAD/FMN-containing dehydrogenase
MTVDDAAISRFRSSFDGDVIAPGDDEYDAARRVWSALFDRRPALVVRPTDVAGVAAAIRFGREADLLIAVRGGGHGITGHATCDDGLVIDLSHMRGVTVDPVARVARANGGALLGELDHGAQAHGLVCPVGTVGHTGVAGLTLGGGVGRLQRRYGLTLDNLTAVELVTADGRLVRASDEVEPDLFWAVRGAGPNFGVVTALEFRLHAFGPNLVRGLRIYRPEDAVDVWHAFRHVLASAPRELSLNFVVGRAIPAEEYVAEIAGGPIALIAFSYIGTESDALAAVAGLADGPSPVMETAGLKPYLEIQGAYDEAFGWGQRYYAYGAFANDLRGETIKALVELVADGPGDPGFTATAQGGAIADLPESATAFAGRSAAFRTIAECVWEDAQDDGRAMDWCRRAMAIAAPDSMNLRYVNEVFEDGTDLAGIYGAEKLERLVAIKRAWDPTNVFRWNHNVRPD